VAAKAQFSPNCSITATGFAWFHFGTELTISNEEYKNMEANKNNIVTKESTDDFSMGATIAVSTLLLAFIGSSFYVLLTSYFELI